MLRKEIKKTQDHYLTLNRQLLTNPNKIPIDNGQIYISTLKSTMSIVSTKLLLIISKSNYNKKILIVNARIPNIEKIHKNSQIEKPKE